MWPLILINVLCPICFSLEGKTKTCSASTPTPCEQRTEPRFCFPSPALARFVHPWELSTDATQLPRLCRASPGCPQQEREKLKCHPEQTSLSTHTDCELLCGKVLSPQFDHDYQREQLKPLLKRLVVYSRLSQHDTPCKHCLLSPKSLISA